MQDQKTILITVGMGFVAKNILRSDVLDVILRDGNTKIVALLPKGAGDLFDRLDSERIIVRKVETPNRGILRRAFLWVCHNLVFTSTTYVLYSGTIKGKPKKVAIFFRKLIAKTFGRLNFIKNNVERVDLFFFRSRPYKEIFDECRPSLVFATNLLNDPLDGEVLKEAKRRKILTVGMPKSWDSFNKLFVHLKSDILLVWNEIVKEEAINLQGYEKDKVFVVGMPQNDDYVKRKGLVERKQFLESLGFSASRPLILFGSGGEYTPEDDKILEVLVGAVKKGEINANILVRPYCGTPNAQRYRAFNGLPFIKVDLCRSQEGEGGKKWAPFDESHLINSLCHANVLVTFASTLAVDASFFNTPTVLVGFDLEKKPWLKSLKRYYETKHYKNIVDTGGARLALSKEECTKLINDYLNNHDLDAENRAVLRDRIGGPSDGRIGERIGKIMAGLTK